MDDAILGLDICGGGLAVVCGLAASGLGLESGLSGAASTFGGGLGLGCPDPSMVAVELYEIADDDTEIFVAVQCVPVDDSCASFTASH